ncbi:bifunctional riboflavin kinase/FAD synthetase [Alkaliphilus sp. MSJ-5]|uniref:Riboflavin biosynthesis protein n=1 Tax=Alkaliphilus flagellatus TaxID=2841507 RepID=A0ABS6G4P6_9FIRM|nr:bifunctional riboflavin kinase/FAD synthetase [Alkaliphilus flagellatus]MBU5677465.1 bifunctional riboflavin kinase/FAD synthetase [Alkaliphilus flagellatus]
MKTIKQYNQLDKSVQRGVALGNFDGIHIGHQKLITTLIEKCRANGLESCVYTFGNHPLAVITGREAPPQITNINMKKKILDSLGVELLYLEEFNKNLMVLSPEDFVKNILVDRLNCRIVVVGFDYNFGYKAQGNVELLKKMGQKHGFEVYEIHPVTIDNKKVGSSTIREYIKNGDIEDANVFLGRPYSIYSKVVHGKGRGHKLGYPTANILIESSHLVPKEGVYATFIKINNSIYKGATCVGTNPTFGANSISIETFIINFNEDIYDQYIELQFIKRLRDQIKFNNVDDLIKQMNQDANNANIYLQL